ncbi:hypothetical protein Hanom_Chr10g00929061 [Helianthus anomalus]
MFGLGLWGLNTGWHVSVKVKMVSWVYLHWQIYVFVCLDDLGCLSLDCIDLLFCWTWVGCGFKSRNRLFFDF